MNKSWPAPDSVWVRGFRFYRHGNTWRIVGPNGWDCWPQPAVRPAAEEAARAVLGHALVRDPGPPVADRGLVAACASALAALS